jgi:RNA polymerase sigma-70 factor (ECF subfamily)
MTLEGRVTEMELAGLETSSSVGELDEELALAARSNLNSFEALYRRHQLGVFRFMRGRTASNDEAAELTSIAFERALRSIDRYKPSGGRFVAWLFTIARNSALDADRARRRHGSGPAFVPQPQSEPREPVLLEDAVVERERMADLRARVERLPAVQRDSIVLRYAGRLTAREISGVLGKSEAATQKILSRALDSLRESYRDDA